MEEAQKNIELLIKKRGKELREKEINKTIVIDGLTNPTLYEKITPLTMLCQRYPVACFTIGYSLILNMRNYGLTTQLLPKFFLISKALGG